MAGDEETLIREDPVIADLSEIGVEHRRMANMRLTSKAIVFSPPKATLQELRTVHRRSEHYYSSSLPRRLLWLALHLHKLLVFPEPSGGGEPSRLELLLDREVRISLADIRGFQTWAPRLSGVPLILLGANRFSGVSFSLLRSISPTDQQAYRGPIDSKQYPEVIEHYDAVETAWQIARGGNG